MDANFFVAEARGNGDSSLNNLHDYASLRKIFLN